MLEQLAEECLRAVRRERFDAPATEKRRGQEAEGHAGIQTGFGEVPRQRHRMQTEACERRQQPTLVRFLAGRQDKAGHLGAGDAGKLGYRDERPRA
jgi:hypothetical protein